MNIQIDAKGKQCPLPVIEAKNAISGMTEAGIVEVTVDNEIAVQNLTKMADHKGLKAKSEKKSDQEYTVWMEVTEEFVKNNIKVMIIEFGRPGSYWRGGLEKGQYDKKGRSIGVVQPYPQIRAAWLIKKNEVNNFMKERILEEMKKIWEEENG